MGTKEQWSPPRETGIETEKSISTTEGLEKIGEEQKQIEQEMGRLRQEALTAGKKEYGFDAYKWSDESKKEYDELSEKLEWNNRLRNEIDFKTRELSQKDEEVNEADRQELKLDNFKEFEENFKRELEKANSRVLEELKQKDIELNTKVKIYLQGLGAEEYYISHIDLDQGLLFVSSEKLGKSNVALAGIDVRKIEKIEE